MNLVGLIKKHYLLLTIILIYFLLRLPSLTYQPIFADEAIYIRWAQIAKAEPTLRFISLQDGKTPLFMWAMAPNLIIFEDPLFAGRLLSVVAGLFTLLGIYQIGKKFINQKTAMLGAFLVAVTPFMIFFDRMALVDSMLAAFTVWSIYWSLKLAHDLSLKNTLFLGLLLAGGWMTKTPGMVNIALLPLMLLFFDFKKADRVRRLFRFSSFFGFSALIALIIYLVQKIDPNFHQLSARNSDYVHPLSRLLQYPVDPLIPHFKDTINFIIPFFGPVLILIPLVFIIFFVKKEKVILILLLYCLIPFIFELQFIKAYTSRYILYTIPPLLLSMAWVLNIFWEQKKLYKNIIVIFLLLCFAWATYFSYNLFNNLPNLPLSKGDRRGYLEDWTAGYGLKEIAGYLIDHSQDQTIIVGTEGSFGTLPDGMVIYLDKYFHSTDTQKIIVLGGKALVSDTLRDFSSEKPTFFIANKSRYFNPQESLELIKEYPKAISPDFPQDAILFYKVLPISEEK